MKLALAILGLAAALATFPAVPGRAGSLDDDAPAWRKPRYERPVYVPRRDWEPAPDPYRGASLVPPMTNTWNPPRHEFRDHGHGFSAHRGPSTVIIIDRPHGGYGARSNFIGGSRR